MQRTTGTGCRVAGCGRLFAARDNPGPAGKAYLSWQRAVQRTASVKALHRVLPDLDPNQIAMWLNARQVAPVPHAATVLQTVIEERPRDHTGAVLFASASPVPREDVGRGVSVDLLIDDLAADLELRSF